MVTIANKQAGLDVRSTGKGYLLSLRGLSTDTKPTTAGENSTFIEMDTGKLYYFSNGTWSEFGGGSIDTTAIVGTALVGTATVG